MAVHGVDEQLAHPHPPPQTLDGHAGRAGRAVDHRARSPPSPLFWVKLDSPGPILFKQERLGRESVPFTLFKFRTMRADAESETGPVWATENDPRVTRAGKWLRKFRIDEIPQLLNVLRGDMSLVGPRPEREIFIRKLSEKVPFYAERLLVPPGITGWAQVMYPYAASIEESRRKLQFDLYYIKHMSFFLDMYVLLKTFKTILFGRERTATGKHGQTIEAAPHRGQDRDPVLQSGDCPRPRPNPRPTSQSITRAPNGLADRSARSWGNDEDAETWWSAVLGSSWSFASPSLSKSLCLTTLRVHDTSCRFFGCT